MAEIWGAVAAAVVGAGASAVIANNNKPGAPTPRNLTNELGGIGSNYPQTLSNFQNGTPGFTNNSLGNINTLLQGNPYIDSTGYYNNLSDEDKANIDRLGSEQGVSGVQWLNGHFMDTMNQGDPVAQNAFNQYGGHSGGLLNLEQGVNTATRTNNLQDALNLSPQYLGLTRSANEGYYNALNSFTNAAQQPVQQSAAQTQAGQNASQGFGTFNPSGLYANTNFNVQANPLLGQLNNQAMAQGPSGLQQQQNGIASGLLAQGGQLSPGELRNVQQGSRAGFAARGLDATNASIVDEVMQTDAAQRQRLMQNLGIAQGVQNQGMAELGQQQNFSLNVGNQNFGYGQLGLQAQGLGLQAQQSNQNFGLGSFNANLNSQTAQQQALMQSAGLSEQQRQANLQAQAQAVQAQRAGFLDPFATITGSADTNLFGQLLNANQGNQSTQAGLYGGLLGYGQDVNNTNYNANAAANIAGYNANNSLYGGLASAGGKIAGAYLGNYMGSGGGNTSRAGVGPAISYDDFLTQYPNSSAAR